MTLDADCQVVSDTNDVSDHEISPGLARSLLASTADALVHAGYFILPIMPRDKVPAEFNSGRWTPMGGWNSYSHTKPSDASVTAWKTWPDANVGITLGTPCNGYQLIAIDFDTDDADELDMLQSQLPWSPMRKRGARGYTGFYRASIAVRTKRYMVPAPTSEKPDARRTVLEILTGNAPRQTVMPPSLHPHGMPYRYDTSNAIVPIRQLPVLNADHFERLEDTLEHMGWNGAILEEARRDRVLSTAGGDRDDPNIWRKTNDIALQKLDLWVPELGLPKLKRHSNGRWEAIAAWRESGTGRPMMQRKPNLSFHRNGIKDLGTEIGYTPLDVVGAANSWDFDTCFSWLRAKIGLGDEGDALLHGATTAADAINTVEDETGVVRDATTGALVGATNDNRPSSADLFPDALTRVPGLLGDVIEWIVATARNPDRIMALGGALTVLGTLAGRRDAGPTKAGTSLYVLMLAPSGVGKQHGLNQIHRLMTAAGAKELFGVGEFGSVQALNNHLKRAPLSVCAQDEFGSVLQTINDKRAGTHQKAIAKVLRSTWGINFGVTQTTDFAGTPGQTIHAPCLSIYGVSTPKQFFDSLSGSDIENGTLNRFLLLSASAAGDDVEPELDDAIVPFDLESQLGALFLARDRQPPLFDTNPGGREVIPHRIEWHDEEAKAVFDAMGAEVKRMRREDEALAPFLARTVEMALRLATIRAVGRTLDDPTVDAEDVAWGRDVAMWSAKKMAVEVGDFVSDNPTGEIWGKVKNKLRKAGGSGNRRDVARAFTMSARTMDEIVTGMEGAGLIRVENRRPAGGGKATVWLHLLDGV